MTIHTATPDLEPRFLQPEGWRWHGFKRQGKNAERSLRFGCVFPKDTIPDAIVVCFPGLGDFCEKYFEVARTCLQKNMAFWVIDWAGQGHSTRYLDNPHKRHSAGFEEDVADAREWILGYIKHSSVHPDVGRIPMALLAHSMGGNIGLHYLHQYPDQFECAAFTAPMCGIKAVEFMPTGITKALTTKLNLVMGNSYAPGNMDWKELVRSFPGKDVFSGDPVRGAIHNAWCLADPGLQVGGVTNKWLYEAVKSCAKLRKTSYCSDIHTPALVGIAGKDVLVSNKAIRDVFTCMPHTDTMEFPDSQHEILLEREEIRAPFFDSFFALIKKTIIDNPESLKRF